MLLTLIITTALSIAAFGIHGAWVLLIGLGLMAAIEKKRPGTNFAEGAVAFIFIAFVFMTVLEYILRLCCNQPS
ncbi:MAG: hypothetical protein ACJA1I_000484 [Zhongshania marina]